MYSFRYLILAVLVETVLLTDFACESCGSGDVEGLVSLVRVVAVVSEPTVYVESVEA